MFGGHVRGLVHPVLEQLAHRSGIGDERPWMRSEAREQRQFLTAHEHIHRVDLDEPHVVELPPEVAAIDTAGGPRRGKTLSRQCKPARLGDAERLGQSATVMVTELMTTSTLGRSLRSVATCCI